MNVKYFVIEPLIKGLTTVSTLIDSGCEYLSPVSDFLVRNLNLPRVEMAPHKLTEATKASNKGKELIKEMTKME